VGDSKAKSLHGRRIVVTRAAEQSLSLLTALEHSGAETLLLPVIAFGSPDNPAELDACLLNTGQFDWIFLTSQNALRAVHDRCELLGLSIAEIFKPVKVAAVGQATADASRASGLAVSYISKTHTGVALAEELASEVRGKHIFLPRSNRANPELVETLKKLGASPTSVTAYKTVSSTLEVSPRQQLSDFGPHAILFFSPSAVHILSESLGTAHFREFSTRAVFTAIGPVTERALRQEGIEQILLSSDTTVTAVVSTLIEYFAKSGQPLPAGVKHL